MRIGTKTLAFAFGLTVAALFTQPAPAQISWIEALHGDLSNDRLNPTQLSVTLGSNSVAATSVFGDPEYFTFTLAPGQFLQSIIVSAYAGADPLAFIAVQQGSTFTEPIINPQVGNILGYTHFGPGNLTVGTDILDDMGQGAGAIGFTPPLPTNTYTFWSQQTGQTPVTYQLDFIVAVPGPGAVRSLRWLQ